MIEPTITCPKCAIEIKLTESLAAPFVEQIRRQYDAEMAQKELDISKRENALKDRWKEIEKDVEQAKNAIDQQVADKVKAEKEAIAANEARKAKRATELEMEAKTKELGDLQDLLKRRDGKLKEAQAAQAELLKKQRELDDAKRELDLTVEKRVQGSLAEIRKKAKNDAEEEQRLKVREKEEQIASMQKQIEALKRKAEQGSQQLQGEVLELELEETLQENFPTDSIEPVAKGEFGGDVLHRVMGPTGDACGAILWESKQTKNWSNGWLAKLRDDQRAANAELAVLVSIALPKDIETFGHIDGVWITDRRFAVPLVMALRQTLIEVANLRQAQDGQETKMELVYQYLTGPKFRHRVEAIVEKFTDMQADLNREKKSMTRLWAKREAQIQGVLESTVGMYGDLQGIAGRALQEIEGLEVPLLESGEGED